MSRQSGDATRGGVGAGRRGESKLIGQARERESQTQDTAGETVRRRWRGEATDQDVDVAVDRAGMATRLRERLQQKGL